MSSVYSQQRLPCYARIAYITSCWTLGDAFIGTQGAALYRSWLAAEPTVKGLQDAGVVVSRFHDSVGEFNYIPEFSHILLCYSDGSQLATIARLFNNDLLSFTFVVNIPEFSSEPPFLKAFIVDAKSKTLTEEVLTP